MSEDISHKLILGISSRALFNLDESNRIYEAEGVDAYSQYQIEHENEILEPGIAFHLVKKLLKLNDNGEHVEVILLSRNSADSGLRIFNSIQHYGLNITRAAFSSGESPYQYVQAFGSHLFLSSHASDVCQALAAGCAAATILPTTHQINQNSRDELRIAFDGDAVLFSDESEQIFQSGGLHAFMKNETEKVDMPLNGGPFKGFLNALQKIQKHFPAEGCPIRTALVTARSAPSHKRVIQTLRHWNIRIDEALFLGGLEKGKFLRAFGADIFFDDQPDNCESAAEHVATGHVPNGVASS